MEYESGYIREYRKYRQTGETHKVGWIKKLYETEPTEKQLFIIGKIVDLNSAVTFLIGIAVGILLTLLVA